VLALNQHRHFGSLAVQVDTKYQSNPTTENQKKSKPIPEIWSGNVVSVAVNHFIKNVFGSNKF